MRPVRNPTEGRLLKALRVQVYPEYAAAYNNRGIAYRSFGQHERAIEDYNEAIRQIPKTLCPAPTGALPTADWAQLNCS